MSTDDGLYASKEELAMSKEDTTEEEVEITAEMEEAAQRMYLSEVMRQLTNSDRFNRFFEINYQVQTYFDKENQTFDVRLIELPPELAAQRLRELASKHAEEHIPMVQSATMADIAALNDIEKRGPEDK